MEYEVQSNKDFPAQKWGRMGKFQPEDVGNPEDITPDPELSTGGACPSTLVPSGVSNSLCLITFVNDKYEIES